MKKILNIKQVIEITGLSRATIYRQEAKGEFPKKMPISKGRVGWPEEAIREFAEHGMSCSNSGLI
ncbi:MAG: AlpA family phage regulatory protein [Candidatus Sedimenticola sp. (ex Thyasira tokunagai)]